MCAASEFVNSSASWTGFFQAEVGAAAALAGLLFVAISVNHAQILSLGRIADRGLGGLTGLLVALLMASLPLIPGQTRVSLGVEIVVICVLAMFALVPLQRRYLANVVPEHRRQPRRLLILDRLTVTVIGTAGVALLWRGDDTGLYVLATGILLCFVAGGGNAWVLLIEINR